MCCVRVGAAGNAGPEADVETGGRVLQRRRGSGGNVRLLYLLMIFCLLVVILFCNLLFCHHSFSHVFCSRIFCLCNYVVNK